MIEAFVKPTAPRSRRDLFRSAGALTIGGGSLVLLGACSGESGGQSGEPGSGGESAGPLTVAKSDVPEGSGVIDGDYVVTQPEAGDFKAFSSVCTHQGCPVSQISDGKILCNCHGSEFSIADGSVMNGPAEQPLTAATVEVADDNLEVSM